MTSSKTGLKYSPNRANRSNFSKPVYLCTSPPSAQDLSRPDPYRPSLLVQPRQSHPLRELADSPCDRSWREHIFLGMVLVVWKATVPFPAFFSHFIVRVGTHWWAAGGAQGLSYVTRRSPMPHQALKFCDCPQCDQSTHQCDENSMRKSVRRTQTLYSEKSTCQVDGHYTTSTVRKDSVSSWRRVSTTGGQAVSPEVGLGELTRTKTEHTDSN